MARTKPSVAALLEQLPPTDKELEASRPPEEQTAEAEKKRRREGDPDPGGKGSKFTGPEPELGRKLAQQVLAMGKTGIGQLIGLIRDPHDQAFKDYKAEYLFHCLTLHAGESVKLRRLVSDVIASQLGNRKVPMAVRRFLVRELQWLGTGDSVGALARLLADEELCEEAAAALLAIGSDGGVAGKFRSAWKKARGRCRLVIVQALGQLRDAGSAELLRRALADADAEVRLVAASALARIGDGLSAAALLSLATQGRGYERVKLTQACLLLAENLVAGGKRQEAARIYDELRRTRNERHEAYVREIATRSLDALERS